MMGFGYFGRPFRWRTSPRAENQDVPFGCLLLAIIPVLFVVSAYFAWWELRFFVQGKTVEATVDDVREFTKGRRYAGGKCFAVRYSFQDESAGHWRTERDEVPLSWSRRAWFPAASRGSGLETLRWERRSEIFKSPPRANPPLTRAVMGSPQVTRAASR
jgi:hypothetical protein